LRSKAPSLVILNASPTERVQIRCSTSGFTVVEAKSPFYWSELVWRFSHLAGQLQYENLILNNPQLNFRNPIYIRTHMSFTMRHEILLTPARTAFLQGQKWGSWIPKLLLFFVQHYDENIQEKCLHPCDSQCLSFFRSILWCIQNGDGLQQDVTKYG
jgi:hypothetical protein